MNVPFVTGGSCGAGETRKVMSAELLSSAGEPRRGTAKPRSQAEKADICRFMCFSPPLSLISAGCSLRCKRRMPGSYSQSGDQGAFVPLF